MPMPGDSEQVVHSRALSIERRVSRDAFGKFPYSEKPKCLRDPNNPHCSPYRTNLSLDAIYVLCKINRGEVREGWNAVIRDSDFAGGWEHLADLSMHAP